MTLHNSREYNQFLQDLEAKTTEGFFFHYLDQCIYITDYQAKLLGIWDKQEQKPKAVV